MNQGMRFFHLILYTPQIQHEQEMKLLLQHYLQQLRFSPFCFYCFNPDQEEELVYNRDSHILSFRGTENYQYGILDKTIRALKWVLEISHVNFQYIIRSNISTFVNLPMVAGILAHLPYQVDYTGLFWNTGAGVDDKTGFTEEKYLKYGSISFASGIAIILSVRAAQWIAYHKREVLVEEIGVVDDLALGVLFAKDEETLGQRFRCGPIHRNGNFWVSVNDETVDRKYCTAYRNKRENREDDVKAIFNLIKKFNYGK